MHRSFVAVTSILALGCSATAWAETFEYVVTVTSVTPSTATSTPTPAPFDALAVGDTLTFSTTFDPTVRDSDGRATAGRYTSAVSELVLDVGFDLIQGAPGNVIPSGDYDSVINVDLGSGYADYSTQVSLPDGSAWAQVLFYDDDGTPFSDDSLPTTLPTPLADFFPDLQRFILREPGTTAHYLLGTVDSVSVGATTAAATGLRAELLPNAGESSVSFVVDSARFGGAGIASGDFTDPTVELLGLGESPFVWVVQDDSGAAPEDGEVALTIDLDATGQISGLGESPFRVYLATDSGTVGELDFDAATGSYPGTLGQLELEGVVLVLASGVEVEVSALSIYDGADGLHLSELSLDLVVDEEAGTVTALVNEGIYGTAGLASGLLSTPGGEVMGVEPSPFRFLVDTDLGGGGEVDFGDGDPVLTFQLDPSGEVSGVEPSPFRVYVAVDGEDFGALDLEGIWGSLFPLSLEGSALELSDGSSLDIATMASSTRLVDLYDGGRVVIETPGYDPHDLSGVEVTLVLDEGGGTLLLEGEIESGHYTPDDGLDLDATLTLVSGAWQYESDQVEARLAQGGSLAVQVEENAFKEATLDGVQVEVTIDVADKTLQIEGEISGGKYTPDDGIDFEGELQLADDFEVSSSSVAARLTSGAVEVEVKESELDRFEGEVDFEGTVDAGSSPPIPLVGPVEYTWKHGRQKIEGWLLREDTGVETEVKIIIDEDGDDDVKIDD